MPATRPEIVYAQVPPQSAAAHASETQVFNSEQIDALVAPVAIYPTPC
jgi:hypothetical protein